MSEESISATISTETTGATARIESVLARVHIIWPLAALFGIHVVLTIGFLYPTALFDEFIYLAYGRALSGLDVALVNLHDSANQHAFYGLFLAPIFRLSGNFTEVYRWALVANCVLAILTSLIVYGVSREFKLSHARTVALVIAASCYPSFLLYPTFTVTENLFIPLFAATTWAGIRLLRNASPGAAISFGAGAGAVYGTHSSGIVVALAAVVALVYAVGTKRLSIRLAGTALGPLAATVGAAMVLDRHILELLYGRTNDLSIDNAVGAFMNTAIWPRAAANVAGCFFALSVATFGSFPAGLGFALQRVRRDRLAPVYTFVVISAIGCLVGGSVFLAIYPEGTDRPNYLFAARYLEGVSVIPILWGLVALSDPIRRHRYVTMALGAIAVSGLACVPALQHLEWFDGPGRRINMIAFSSFVNLFGHASVISIALLTLTVAGVIFLLRTSPLIVWSGVIAVAGLSVSVLERQREYLPMQSIVTGGAPTLPLADAVRSRNVTELAYDMDAFDAFGYALVELQDPHVKLVRFSASTIGVPAYAAVITRRAWNPGNYELVTCEAFADSCLWMRSAARASFDYVYGQPSRVSTMGLYGSEGDATLRYRWTDGDARLRLVNSSDHPRGKYLTVVLFTFSDTAVVVRVDGHPLFDGHVRGERRCRFLLKAAPRTVEIKSATFVPTPVNGFTRRLGVQLRELQFEP